MTIYKNPWYVIGQDKEFQTNAKPIKYKGCHIFHVKHNQWDVVKNKICIAQRTSLNRAKQCAEIVEDLPDATFREVRARMLAKYNHY